MPIELIEKGCKIKRETTRCPHCTSKIVIKYDAVTKEVLDVNGGTAPNKIGIIKCYECKAKLQWSSPE